MERKGFTPTKKPWKMLPWQITEGTDMFEKKKIQIKYYPKTERGSWNFKKYQVIFAIPKDWKELKKKIKGK